MNLFSRGRIPTCAALLCVASLVSCSTVERTFSGPKAQFSGGSAIEFRMDLPQPDPSKYAIGELDIRINSDLISGEERQRLVQAIGRTVDGRWKPWTTRNKEPQFRLVISQINSQQDWEGSNMGALVGGTAGAVAGANMDENAPWRGFAIGGLAGSGIGYVAFGSERNAWAFHISVTQATAGVNKAAASADSKGTAMQSGVGNGTSISGAGQSSGMQVTEDIAYVGSTQRYEYGCAVAVESSSFSGRASIEESARKTLISRLPEAMLGGGSLAGW